MTGLEHLRNDKVWVLMVSWGECLLRMVWGRKNCEPFAGSWPAKTHWRDMCMKGTLCGRTQQKGTMAQMADNLHDGHRNNMSVELSVELSSEHSQHTLTTADRQHLSSLAISEMLWPWPKWLGPRQSQSTLSPCPFFPRSPCRLQVLNANLAS